MPIDLQINHSDFLSESILADVMPKTKKIFLLHERRETWRFKIGKTRHGFCGQCQEETIWLTSSEAAQFSDLSERKIFRLAENAAVHFTESDSGSFLICQRSLEDISHNQEAGY